MLVIEGKEFSLGKFCGFCLEQFARSDDSQV